MLGKGLKGKGYKLMIDNLDDLWHLYNLIEEHDIVGGETYRRVEKVDDKLRPDKAAKKRVWLAVDVEALEFHEFSNRLRVHGVVVKGPEDISLSSYHTLNFNTDKQIEIEKPKPWRKHQLEQLKNAIDATQQPQVIILSIEDDNAVIAQLHQYGVRKAATINAQGFGKFYSGTTAGKSSKKLSDVKKEFFDDILLQLQQLISQVEAKTDDVPLIVVGPGFTKDEFVKFCRDKQLSVMKNILVEGTGQAGMVGVQEALKRGVVTRLVSDSRVSFETELVEQVLEGIAKNGPVSYGLVETKAALDVGAVKQLLMTDSLIRGKNEQIEELLIKTENMSGTITIISTVHDAGKQLESLGGVAALLRYKV